MKKQIIPYFAVNDPYEIVYRKSSTSTPVKPHTHNAAEIYFTLTDLPDVLLNDTVSSVSKGSLIVIPPHNVHQLFNQKLTVYERYIITINSSWLNNVLGKDISLMNYASSTGKPAIIKLTDTQVTALKKKLNHFIKTDSVPAVSQYSSFFEILTLLDSYISEGLTHMSSVSVSRSQQNVNDIISFINRHLTEPLNLDIIAEEFHMNKDYLGRLFKEHTHATIGHYISVQRVSLSQNMLANGYTVAQVQDKMGFTSYAYFFKFFKKMTGISPSQYRKDSIGNSPVYNNSFTRFPM